MYTFNSRRKNIRNPKQIKFGLFKSNNINSINTSLGNQIISRINNKSYSCGCGKK